MPTPLALTPSEETWTPLATRRLPCSLISPIISTTAPPTVTLIVTTSPSLASSTRTISISSSLHLLAGLYAIGQHLQGRRI
jgi:hypothetical protein